MLHIEKAEYCSDYKIKVFFNDGLVGIADFENKEIAIKCVINKP